MENDNTNIFTFLGITCIILSALFSYIHFMPTQYIYEEFKQPIFLGMLAYLLVLFIRTMVMLFLSFLDYMTHITYEAPTHYPLVSVIVPAYNEGVVIKNAILSVKKLNYPNLEILVIDDGSQDNTLEKAKELEQKGRVRVIYKENGGKAEALNRGISEALGEFVLCMDADSMLDPEVLMHAMPYFEKDPNLAAVAGNVIVANTTKLLTWFQKLEYIIGLNFYKTGQSFLGVVNIVPGPLGVFKRSEILKIGGYRSNTFAEDCDLSLRLLMNGNRVKYCRKMLVHTEAPEEFNQLLTQRYRWNRGILQAIKVNSSWMLKPHKSVRNALIVYTMFFESILIPLFNFFAAATTIYMAINYSNMILLNSFFIGLSALDLCLALYSVLTEKRMGALVLLAMINRITYSLAMEIIRFYSIVDEILDIPMKWGTLKRRGI